MTSRIGRLACVALGTAFLPLLARGQASTTRGWSLGAHLQAASLTVEGGDAQSAGGAGIRVGYGFNRIVTGFVHIDGSEFDVKNADLDGMWSMAHVEFGARFHFANSLRRWVPYLEASAGGRAVSVKDAVVDGQHLGKVTFNGGAFTLGGGISAFLKPTLALDVSLKLTDGEFNEIQAGNISARTIEVDAKSSRLGVGLIWWP